MKLRKATARLARPRYRDAATTPQASNRSGVSAHGLDRREDRRRPGDRLLVGIAEQRRRHPSPALRNRPRLLAQCRHVARPHPEQAHIPSTSPARIGPAASPALDENRSILRSVTLKGLPVASAWHSRSRSSGKSGNRRDLRTINATMAEAAEISGYAFGIDWNEPPWRLSLSLGSCYFQSHSQDRGGPGPRMPSSRPRGRSEPIRRAIGPGRYVRRRHDRAFPDGEAGGRPAPKYTRKDHRAVRRRACRFASEGPGDRRGGARPRDQGARPPGRQFRLGQLPRSGPGPARAGGRAPRAEAMGNAQRLVAGLRQRAGQHRRRGEARRLAGRRVGLDLPLGDARQSGGDPRPGRPPGRDRARRARP